MKTLKRMCSGLLALVMALSLAVVAMPAEAEAAAKETGIKSCPSKYRIYTGSVYNYGLELELKSAKYEIASVTTNDKKNLKADVVSEDKYYYAYNGSVSSDSCTYRIGLYAKKEGKYTVTVNIKNTDNPKFSYPKKITVYARNDSPFKKVTIGGKDAYINRYYFSKKALAFKVQAAPGYKIKKLEVGTYTKKKTGDNSYDTEMNWEPIKNGAKIKLSGQKSERSSSSSNKSDYSESFRNYFWKSLAAETCVRITYTDKYTKQLETSVFTFYYIKM